MEFTFTALPRAVSEEDTKQIVGHVHEVETTVSGSSGVEERIDPRPAHNWPKEVTERDEIR